MRIQTVRVMPRGDKFEYTISPPTADVYMDEDRPPNDMGFYHFNPDSTDPKDAIKKLIGQMIKRHSEEISRLCASREALADLRNTL